MTVYAVGAGRTFERISDLTDRLMPGDVVELHSPIVDSVVLDRLGAPSRTEFEPVRVFLGVHREPPRRADAGAIRAIGPFA